MFLIKLTAVLKEFFWEDTIAVPIKEIAQQLNIQEHNIHYAALSLLEHEIKFCEYNKEVCVAADKDTFSAYTSEKYLHDGRQRGISKIKDYLNIAVALIAITSAIYTATIAIRKSDHAQLDMENLKQEIQQLKNQLNHSNPR